MKPKICAVIFGESLEEIALTIREAEKLADLIEIRFDLSAEINPEKVRKLTSLPLIATNRSKTEGGRFEGPAEKQAEPLLEAAKSGFDYVDLEVSFRNLPETVSKLKNFGVKPIVSFHDFCETPSIEELEGIIRRQKKHLAEICKVVTMARRIEDNLTILSLLSSAVKRGEKIVAFCMGRLGLPSRILSPIFGGQFTYASVKRGKEAAPGQLTLEELKQIYKLMGFEG